MSELSDLLRDIDDLRKELRAAREERDQAKSLGEAFAIRIESWRQEYNQLKQELEMWKARAHEYRNWD